MEMTECKTEEVKTHRALKFSMDHHFKLSKGGYLHIPILMFSFGGNGGSIVILGVAVIIALIKE